MSQRMSEHTAAIVLAGGAARRMGGRDKTRATIGGQTALARVLAAAPVGTRIVVGPEQDDGRQIAATHHAAFVREDPPGTGPAAALGCGADALADLPADTSVLVLGGDMPHLRTDTLRRLLDAVRASGIVHALSDRDGHTQYLCAAWPLGLLRDVLAAQGDLAGIGLHRLYTGLDPAQLALHPGAANETADIDTLSDLAAARAAAGTRIALAQLTIPEDPAAVRDLVADTAAQAAARGARILLLPEATLTPFGTDLRHAARHHADAFEQTLAHAADLHDLVIVAGSFTPAPSDPHKIRNTALIRGPRRPDGTRLDADYHKIHLYDAHGHRESAGVEPGTELVLIARDGLTFGIATCYDLRFPDQFTALSRAGAHAILVPISFADGPGKADQLRLLLRARALDSTSWVLGADQVPPPGYDGPGTRGVGGSAVVGPLGDVRAALGPHETGLLVTDIDVDTVLEARKALPVLDHAARAEFSGTVDTLRS